jgi:molybdopterin synthase sulfur carrier subunit
VCQILNNMKTSILLFGLTADLIGSTRLEVGVSEGATASDVIERLSNEYAKLKNHKLLFAVNQEYVGSDQVLRDGDELAIFTGVSGG